MFGEAQSISVGTPLKISASSNIKTEDDVYMLKLNQNGLSLPYGFYGSDDLEAVRRRNYHFEFLAILLQKFDAVLKRNSPEEKNNISGELTPQMLKKNISLLNKTQDDPSHCHDTHPKKSGCFGPEGPLGVPPDKEFVSRIERVMEMETALQRVSLPPLEAMDPDNTNNVVTLGSLTSVNEFWLPLLVAMKDKRVLPETFEITSDLSVLVDSLEFHAGMIEVVAASPWGTIKDFVLVRALITMADFVSIEWRKISENYDKAVFGIDPKPDWKHCLDSDLMPWVTSKSFVDRYLDPRVKSYGEDMMKYIRLAFRDRVNELDWMDEQTKKNAILKESQVKLSVAYPEWFSDEEPYLTALYGLPDTALRESVDAGRLASRNLITKRKNMFDYSWLGIERTMDIWGIQPTNTNAYYRWSSNEIVITASMLVPPFLFIPGPPAPPEENISEGTTAGVNSEEVTFFAMSYGSIGMLMGHELTHGFDTIGRKFDGKGTLHNWWSDASLANFEEKGQCMVAQYASYR
eukprot:GHVR01166843.1.p1 GENE.GHVR01166843.1~~GHVR01166843.1.p1  ORF type:complete len:519 (-),score=69.19 GHVR01166843.1:1061-2617(-)